MRKIFLAAVIAAFAAARNLHSAKVMAIEQSQTIFADADPASLYKVEFGYNLDLYYGLETGQDDVYALHIPDSATLITEVEDLAVVDNWIQAYIASDANINL